MFRGAVKMENLAVLTADCYQVTDLFEEQISEATYGDGCKSICKAVIFNHASEGA